MTRSSHIAVFAFPFGTHAAPLSTLVHRLAASAPPAAIFSFFSTPTSNAKIFSARPKSGEFDNIKAYNVWDGVPEGHVLSSNSLPLEAIGLFLRSTPHNFKKGVEEAEAETGVKVTCFLTDAFLWFSGEMAAERGVPWVALWTSGACALSIHLHTDLIRSRLGTTTGTIVNSEANLDFLPGLSAIQISDLQEGVISGDLESPFAHLLHKMGLKLRGATAVVLNSFQELEPTIIKDLKSNLRIVLSIGLTRLATSFDDQSDCLLFLDKQKSKSVAYISFGTVMTPPPKELAALAEALQATGVPFLWSIRDQARNLLPKGFLEWISSSAGLGKIVSWAPQLQVLAHDSIGVFVTHCGWNSVLESISNGVPMICRPFFGDQMLNSRVVEEVWRIGVEVEGGVFTKSGTMNAIDQILSKENEIRQNAGVLKEHTIEAMGSNGSSARNIKALNALLLNIE